MKQTLYISDLDGTLLNKQKLITPNTTEVLNKFMAKGGAFSVATARTPATVESLLASLHMNTPVVVMNGAALYNLETHHYIDVAYIAPEIVEVALERLGRLVEEGFIYTIVDHKLVVYYKHLEQPARKRFYMERKDTGHKQFVSTPLQDCNDVAYFVFMDQKEKIQPIYECLASVEGLALVMYKDIYEEETYILEVYSHEATKANGITKLKALYGYEDVICFGDNLNDLSMFESATQAYAVENALEEVKNAATAVIGSNEADGVAEFIKTQMSKEAL